MEKVGAFTDRTTEGGEWRSGNPASGQQATPMLSAYFNMLQRELVSVVESAGIELDKEDDGQLLQAIRRLRGGAATNFGQWLWSSSTAGNPGAGRIALNNATPGSATTLFIDEISAEDVDFSQSLGLLRAGDTVTLQERDTAELSHRLHVTGPAVDHGTYRSIPVEYVSGEGGLPETDAAVSVLLTQSTAASVSTDGVAGSFSNLRASASGTNATVNVSADALCLKNASNQQKVVNAIALSINSAANGANGLDIGALTAATWYSTWVIYNPTTQTLAGLLSLSATAPTLPAGYTHRARVGWVRTDSTANKYPLLFFQSGRRVTYVPTAGTNLSAWPVMASGTAAAAAVAWASFAPPTASVVRRIAYAATGGSVAVLLTANGTFMAYTPAISSFSPVLNVDFPTYGPNVYWTSSGNGTLYCLGWEDNL